MRACLCQLNSGFSTLLYSTLAIQPCVIRWLPVGCKWPKASCRKQPRIRECLKPSTTNWSTRLWPRWIAWLNSCTGNESALYSTFNTPNSHAQKGALWKFPAFYPYKEFLCHVWLIRPPTYFSCDFKIAVTSKGKCIPNNLVIREN